MKKTRIRTRYAPSPTGYLHIGGARTALFNYLFAKHFNGDFIVRIEDTDIARNVAGGEESQLDNLEWLQIYPDESPKNPNEKYGKYRQSEKLDRYNEIVEILLKKGLAYKAYDTTYELEKQRAEQIAKGIFSFRYDRNWLKISDEEIKKREVEQTYSIRIALPKNHDYEWNDLVRGLIKVNSEDIGDWVIIKSDKYPTYNFAVVVDDFDMQISHVLRGEEHITNTPKQLAVYEAMGWDKPVFGHLTLITNSKGVKLSKRDDSVKQFISNYKEDGYVSWAISNYLALLGWTSKDTKEIMTKEELIEKFDPERLSASPSKFDMKKMNWYGKHYLQEINKNEIFEYLESLKDKKWLDLFIETFLPNAFSLSELKRELKEYENPMIEKPEIEINDVVKKFKQNLNFENFSVDSIQKAIDKTGTDLNVNGKKLFLPIRLATTFNEHGPELAKAIYLYGKEIIQKRLGNVN
ncbi:glutamate--tRNA ligase [[Mycoplasma] mobile]|uniref:Glutamate--tRNA ligase n=1 Tax=Mycoplasma mobile (strain ATCC 43663 / 163K / NCTC 11711) TaxID=267748 RepID=SYE_MYCM1|nr:glutamate--tRNA ligase [[Mycoplasma] mobile]Q6KIT3.1 RecName: Full=Glutamate--tRNA ligase; AltName: Full=Glutamyl-tRNA synthetase; Short=GluRS [Mycoplasma mobile 163K]AAT27491.1 glutamyl-tRNA synthetase [Mycoplasma mobile 163K]